jgi:sugar phosphate isomerase/epimerase
MYRLGINFDEISDDIDVAIKVMQGQNVRYGELRTVNQKNFVFWSDSEVDDFKAKIDASGIELIAAATPLFKWYDADGDPDIPHDSFGFNPRLSHAEKMQTIDRAFSIANKLGIPRLRIFSGLGSSSDSGENFAKNELLIYALSEADKHNIDLYLENEPVCKVHRKQEIIALLETNKNERLKLWLDIANLVEIGEEVDGGFLAIVSSRLSYVHVKDFIVNNGEKTYVPAGRGDIPYKSIMKRISKVKPDDIIVTVETHARKNKSEMSIASIIGTRNILEAAGVNYE